MTQQRARPAGQVCHRTVFRGDLVTVVDWRCNGVDMCHDAVGDAYEVIVVRRGSFLRRCGPVEMLAGAGTVSLWRPSDVYRISHPLRELDRCTAFVLSPAVAMSLFGDIAPDLLEAYRTRYSGNATPLSARSYLRHHELLNSAGTVDRVAAEELSLAFIAEAFAARDDMAAAVAASRRAILLAAEVRALLNDRFQDPLSLTEIAGAVSCSPFHLSRMVKAAEGRSIHQMLMELRLRAALEWLLDSREEIGAIAIRVGFASHGHLTAAFRREYGMSPSEARRRMRK